MGSWALAIAMAFSAAGSVADRSACEGVEPLRSEQLAYAAVVRSRARLYRGPGTRPFHMLGRENVNGHATVLGVLSAVPGADCEPRWYHVQLPLKPNGSTGYVRAADVDLLPVRTRIVADLSERRLVVFRGGRKVLETAAGIGSPATPTPVGRFYVNQRIRALDPSGPFGPGGVGISAFSEVLTDWVQGGPIAIHGTNRPETIGFARSTGCLRVRNDVLKRIFRIAVPGTPVVVRP